MCCCCCCCSCNYCCSCLLLLLLLLLMLLVSYDFVFGYVYMPPPPFASNYCEVHTVILPLFPPLSSSGLPDSPSRSFFPIGERFLSILHSKVEVRTFKNIGSLLENQHFREHHVFHVYLLLDVSGMFFAAPSPPKDAPGGRLGRS